MHFDTHKLKYYLIGALLFLGLIGILSIRVDGDMYPGYTRLLSRVMENIDPPKHAHDLDLSKYRPNLPAVPQ